MSIENEIKEMAAAVRDLTAAITNLGKQAFTVSEAVAAPAATEAKPEPKEVKKGRGKAAKEEKAAPPVDDFDLDLGGDLDLDDDFGLDETEVTIKKEDLKATLTKLAKKSRDQAVGLMKRHGFKNFDEITEDKYAVIAKEAEKALAE